MALKVTKTEVWSAEIPDRPGGLAAVLERIAEAGASLDCVIARRDAGNLGKGVVFLTPITGAKQKAAARAAGLGRSSVATLRVESPHRAGYGAVITRAIQRAGINLRGISGARSGKTHVAYFGFDTKADAAKAAAAIRKVPPPQAGAKRKSASRKK